MKNLLFFLFILSFSSSFAKGIEFEKITLEQAKEKAKKENKIIFIDYYADWCGPCKWLAKNVFTETEVGELFNENFINLKINADHDNFIGTEYSASALPTLLFIDHTGKLKKKVVGAVDKETLISNANYVIHPDTDPIAIERKKFDDGERGKDFLMELAILMSEAELDIDFLVKAYRKEYPKTNLDDLTDFTFFFLEDADKNDASVLQNFFDGFEKFYEDEERKSMALQKLVNTYVLRIEQDAAEKNEHKRDEHIKELVNFVKKHKIKEIDIDKISEAFIAYYDEKLDE